MLWRCPLALPDLGGFWVCPARGVPRGLRSGARCIPRSSAAGNGLRCRVRDLAQRLLCCGFQYLRPGISCSENGGVCLLIDTWGSWC